MLIIAATANASPGWAPPVVFSVPPNAFGGQDEVRYQDGGIATEAFLEVQSLSPLLTSLHVGTAAPGGGYADQLTVPTTAEWVPLSPQIEVAPDGAAVAVWMESMGPDVETAQLRYRAAYRPAGSGSWEAPFLIAADNERNKEIYEYVTPVIGTDGTAAVGVQHIASGEVGSGKGQPIYRDDVAVHGPSGGWQPPARLSPTGESGEDFTLGIDAHGDVTAAYALRFSEGSTPADGRTTAIVRRLASSSGVWGPEENITGSDITHSVYALHLGENEAGDAVLAYQYGEVGKAFQAWGDTRQGSEGAWAGPAQLVETGAGSAPQAVAVSPDGVAYVLDSFQGNSSGEDCVGVMRAQVEGRFPVQRCISPTNEDAFNGSIAFLGNDAYFAWRANVPGPGKVATIQGASWPDASALPDVSHNLDVPELEYGDPTLLTDGDGSVVAFYTLGGQLRAAAYDAEPPILLGAGVPTSATVGQSLTFSSTFTDLWSGLGAGQPTWSFGDGTSPESGTSVTHSFSTPGVYTITLSAADALGNTATSSYTIAVSSVPQSLPIVVVDKVPPDVTLSTPRCSKRLSRKACKRYQDSPRAWKTLTGAVTDPAPSSGIASVQVAVYLTSGKRIEGLVGKSFHKSTKSKVRTVFVSAKLSGGKWSLSLPKLKAGRYTILVRATDRAGNVSPTLSKTILLS